MEIKLAFMLKYIKLKANVKTYMELAPQQAIIEQHVEALGLKVTSKGKKEATVHLDNLRDNWQTSLSMAHYSLGLSSVFMMEFAIIHIAKVDLELKTEPLCVRELFTRGMRFADFFKREHLINYNPSYESLIKRIQVFASEGFCIFDAKANTISLPP